MVRAVILFWQETTLSMHYKYLTFWDICSDFGLKMNEISINEAIRLYAINH